MEPRVNEPIAGLSVRKSNNFIAAKYKSTLLENQIMAIALTRIEVNSKNPMTASLEAHLYPGDLKRLVSDQAHIYRDLSKISKTMTGHTMFLEDGKGNFKAFAVVTNADYIDGVFTIKFNNEIRDHVLGLEDKGGYTSFQLSVMTDFKKNSSFRLYEVLRKEIYKIPKDKDAYIEVEYNISELKFIIGIANSDDPQVKKAMSYMGKNIDWDGLYDALDKKDKLYEEWRDFQRRILKPAQEELEEKSDVRFEYSGIREGRKTKRISFKIYRNTPKNPTIIDERKAFLEMTREQDRQLEMPMDLYPEFYEEFVGHNELTKEDLTLLLKKCSLNVEKVRNAIEMADSKKDMITNYMGWLVRCIEEGWTETNVIDGSAERASILNMVMDNYKNADHEELSKNLWEKQKAKEDFKDFLEFVNIFIADYDIDTLEVLYSYQELTQAYADFKMKRPVNL